MKIQENKKLNGVTFSLIMLIIFNSACNNSESLPKENSVTSATKIIEESPQEDETSETVKIEADETPEESPQENKVTENESHDVSEEILSMGKAGEILGGMTLDEKIYQMFFVKPEALTGIGTAIQAGDATKSAIELKPVGGVIYFASNIQTKEQISTMITNTQNYSEIPLFIGVDEEGGRVARISGNPQMGFEKIAAMANIGASGDSNRAFGVGEQIAKNIAPLGFNVDFAPVADIITNPNNTEIGDRAFGTEADLVSQMVSQKVIGLQSNGVCAAVKHFPGHGSTQLDSHNGYSESLRTLDELRSVEFLPFKAGIEAGSDFVLISHMSAVNVDNSGVPSSISKIIVTDILKNELNYEKIIITDAMNMGAVTDIYSSGDAAVLAIEAGIDMILMPENMDEAFSGVKAAVDNGRISEERINESVLKILQIKIDRHIIK